MVVPAAIGFACTDGCAGAGRAVFEATCGCAGGREVMAGGGLTGAIGSGSDDERTAPDGLLLGGEIVGAARRGTAGAVGTVVAELGRLAAPHALRRDVGAVAIGQAVACREPGDVGTAAGSEKSGESGECGHA